MEPYGPQDRPVIEAFVAAIQDHERLLVPELRPGTEIAADYAARIVAQIEQRDGVLVLAKEGAESVGFACAWMDEDDDPLLAAAHRPHALISDLYVRPEWRRRGIGRALLDEIEQIMRRRGVRKLCITAKAANIEAVRSYEAAQFRAYEIDFWKEL
jgi:ribosomal protein S18 acetylase RimI-like enzyme